MGVHIFTKIKNRQLEKEKKIIFQLFQFKNSWIFLDGVFQKMFNVSLEYIFL